MHCPKCNNHQCYICSQDIHDYNHFTKKGCPLFDPRGIEARHEAEIKKAEEAAKARIQAEQTDISAEDLEIKVSDIVKAREAQRKAEESQRQTDQHRRQRELLNAYPHLQNAYPGPFPFRPPAGFLGNPVIRDPYLLQRDGRPMLPMAPARAAVLVPPPGTAAVNQLAGPPGANQDLVPINQQEAARRRPRDDAPDFLERVRQAREAIVNAREVQQATARAMQEAAQRRPTEAHPNPNAPLRQLLPPNPPIRQPVPVERQLDRASGWTQHRRAQRQRQEQREQDLEQLRQQQQQHAGRAPIVTGDIRNAPQPPRAVLVDLTVSPRPPRQPGLNAPFRHAIESDGELVERFQRAAANRQRARRDEADDDEEGEWGV